MQAPLPVWLPQLIEPGPSARIPTQHGEFELRSWLDRNTGAEHLTLHIGDLGGAGDTPVRVHSECFTGDVMGSLRCDCGAQLQLALERIAQTGRGLVIYMRGHEGRGIGLAEKLRAYALQDRGLDTVDANLALGHPVDARRFEAAAAILRTLGVTSVRLMSNNPMKLQALREQGIHVVALERHETEVHDQNAAYLATKRVRLGHLLALPGGERQAASSEPGHAADSRVTLIDALLQAEGPDQRTQASHLAAQAQCGGSAFLDQGDVLLRHVIQTRDG